MEEGWILDSFYQFDMFIDKSYTTYLKYIHEKEIPENDCREMQLILYKKPNTPKEFDYRMIVGFADQKNKTIKIGDGYIKVQDFNCTVQSNEFANYTPMNADEVFTKKYGDNIEVLKCNFSKPILSGVVLVKFGGKTAIGTYNEDKKEFIQLYVCDY